MEDVKFSPFTKRAALYRQRLLLVTLLVVTFGVIPLGFIAGVPAAGICLGVLLLVLAGARLVLPVEALGALVVRMRYVDVMTLALLGTVILVLSTTSPNL